MNIRPLIRVLRRFPHSLPAHGLSEPGLNFLSLSWCLQLHKIICNSMRKAGWHMGPPAGVPNDIIAQLNAVIGKVVNTPEVKTSFNRQGLDLQTNTPEEFAAFIRGELAQNAKLIRLSGAKTE